MSLVLLSAALYGAASPAHGGGPLAWIALCPLLFACVSTTPARAAGLGLLFGLAGTVAVAWWFPGMLQRYFDVPAPAAWLALLAVGATADGVPNAFFGAWLAWSARRGGVTPFAVGVAFALGEFLRSHGPLSNPYGLIGYSLHGSIFAQAADLAGPLGLGALVAAVNAAIGAALFPELARGRPGRAALATALLVLAVAGYGALRLTEHFGDGQPLRVAAVQGAVERGVHWDRSQRAANLTRYLELNGEAARGAPELVFWPEFAVDFYLAEDTPERARLVQGVRAGGADVVLGASRYAFAAERTLYFNSVFVIDRSGAVGSPGYDKQRLVPFSEYAPFGGFLRSDSAVYSPGREPRLLDTHAGRVGAFVCAEALYPDVARGLVRAGAEILANPSNDYWFGAPQPFSEQLAAASFRAIENRRALVRATSTGITAFVDPHGRITARSAGSGPEVISAEIERSRAVTPFQYLGDAGVAVLCLAGVASSHFVRRRSPRGGETHET
ncbi:MAG TPA: apolipoprotein N-acyltransferase [Myxococcota bacterium]|nr:apolipoprotein N-acyltransferase [Myxococcota bacterium]